MVKNSSKLSIAFCSWCSENHPWVCPEEIQSAKKLKDFRKKKSSFNELWAKNLPIVFSKLVFECPLKDFKRSKLLLQDCC